MEVLIFTEISKKIGYGHVVRCSVLYDLFYEKGYEVTFILFGEEYKYEVIGNRRHKFIEWHNTDIINKVDFSKRTISVIDSYIAPYKVYEYISKNSEITIFIDDNNRIQYPRGIILNPTIYGTQMNYISIDNQMVYFLGSKYVLLRKGFNTNSHRRISDRINNILITLGGSDTFRICTKIIELLKDKKYEIDIIGACNSNIDLNEDNIRFYENINEDKVNELMQKSDLAISAGGQTLYELVKVGTPAIVYCLADNQRENIDYLLKLNIINEIRNFDSELVNKVESYNSYNYRLSIFNKCKDLELGNGIKDFVDWIGEKYEV